jgi:hypothetical protein
VGALDGVAVVRLHARMETTKTAIPNQLVNKRNGCDSYLLLN